MSYIRISKSFSKRFLQILLTISIKQILNNPRNPSKNISTVLDRRIKNAQISFLLSLDPDSTILAHETP